MEFRDRNKWTGLLSGRMVLIWLLLASIACFITIITIIPSNSQLPSQSGLSDAEVKSLFHNYTLAFGKQYAGPEEEEKITRFKNSLKIIRRLNSGQDEHLLKESGGSTGETGNDIDNVDEGVKNFVTWTEGMPKNQGAAKWGLTAFADLSPDEFKHRYLDVSLLDRILKRHSLHSHHRHHFKHRDHGEDEEATESLSHSHANNRHKRSVLPDKIDWRDKQIISSIKHQKDCGACWAFSTVETVESMQALATGHLQELSVQQVIDCSKNGNSGCSGGDTCTAVAWMSNRKLSSEAQYPLTLKDGSCKLQSSAEGVQVAGNYSCSRLIDDEDKMVELLATHGPVAVAVDATNWQYYVGGVIQWNCETSVNHAVQIVGYDRTTTPHHYIVRNSWGPKFGDNGYLYIATNKNLCGIATEVVWLSVQ